MISATRLGNMVLQSILHSVGVFGLLYESGRNIKGMTLAPVRQVFYRQIYFTGVEAVTKVSIIGAVVGIVIITQVSNFAGRDAVLLGKILAWTVVRELGPLAAAIMIIARSCSAVTSELASMKIRGEVWSIRSMGIDEYKYLILPRVAAITISVFVLTFYFNFVAITGGIAASAMFANTPFWQQFTDIYISLGFFEVGISVLKSFVFGMLIAGVSCYHGLKVGSSVTEIPQATTNSVMHSLFFVFIADGIITVVSFI